MSDPFSSRVELLACMSASVTGAVRGTRHEGDDELLALILRAINQGLPSVGRIPTT